MSHLVPHRLSLELPAVPATLLPPAVAVPTAAAEFFGTLVPLDLLCAGEAAVVADLDGPSAAVNRLQELGLRVGQRLRMLCPGPPHLLQLGDTRLCLRPDSGVFVLVQA